MMKNIMLGLLFICGIATSIIHFVYRNTLLEVIFIICGSILLIFYLANKHKKYRFILIMIYFFFIFFLIKILVYQDYHIKGVMDFAVLISHIGYALYLYEEKNAVRYFLILYYSTVFILFMYFLRGYLPGQISEYSSENVVNYIVLAFSILLIGLYYKNSKKIIVFPAIVTFIVSLWTLGRTGVISSLLLLIGVIILKYMKRLGKLKMSFILMFFCIMGSYLINVLINFMSKVIYRFGQRETFFKDSPRAYIWNDYLENLDFKKVIFGFDFKTHYFWGFTNLHNSYIDIHYLLGLSGIFIILLLAISLYKLLKRHFYLFFVLTICLLLRGSTDTVMLVGFYDYVLIFLLLFCWYHDKNTVMKRQT